MNSNPCVLVVSNSSIKPKSLIKLLTKSKVNDDVDGCSNIYPWKLKTKYYTTDINFVSVEEDLKVIESLCTIEGLIILMDSNKTTGLDDLKKWEFIEEAYQPEIKLLVSKYCNLDTKITKAAANEWCIKRSFELVELYPFEEPAEEEDGLIPEKKGVERIIEALEAHIWPNLYTEKDDKPNGSSSLSGCDISDDFTDLFGQFHIMKESIQSLPVRERKHCAEQIVTAFWKAIGGDDDEISDL